MLKPNLGPGDCSSMTVFGKEVPKEIMRWIFSFRALDISTLLVLLVLDRLGAFYPARNLIVPPEVEITVNGVTTAVENPAHHYPLKVDGTWCTAANFDACGGAFSAEGCCANQRYQNTVPSAVVRCLFYALPLLFLCARHTLLRLLAAPAGYGKPPPPGLPDFLDAFVTLQATWLLVRAPNNVLKRLAGYPRPNYYALLAYAELHGSTSVRNMANDSFPSGHSTLAMGGMAFVALYLLKDLRRLRLGQQQRRSLFFLGGGGGGGGSGGSGSGGGGGTLYGAFGEGGSGSVAAGAGDNRGGSSGGGGAGDGPEEWGGLTSCLAIAVYAVALAPVGVALYVGATRVTDHFHYPADVLTGFTLGLAGATVGVLVAGPARIHHECREDAAATGSNKPKNNNSDDK